MYEYTKKLISILNFDFINNVRSNIANLQDLLIKS